MQNASARLDVALPLHTEHFGLRSQVLSNLSSISRTKVSVLSSSEPVTMLSSTCVATRIVSPSLSFLLHIAPSYPAFWKPWLSSQLDHVTCRHLPECGMPYRGLKT